MWVYLTELRLGRFLLMVMETVPLDMVTVEPLSTTTTGPVPLIAPALFADASDGQTAAARMSDATAGRDRHEPGRARAEEFK